MESQPGTYLLILESQVSATVQIGRWCRIDIKPGYYLYAGSAFGPGGLRARLARHVRRAKKRHWHIDYLTEYLDPAGAWYSCAPERLEHRWAQALQAMDGMTPVPGFGCSDCNCQAHLFHSPVMPDSALFASVAGCPVEAWASPRTRGHRPD